MVFCCLNGGGGHCLKMKRLIVLWVLFQTIQSQSDSKGNVTSMLTKNVHDQHDFADYVVSSRLSSLVELKPQKIVKEYITHNGWLHNHNKIWLGSAGWSLRSEY